MSVDRWRCARSWSKRSRPILATATFWTIPSDELGVFLANSLLISHDDSAGGNLQSYLCRRNSNCPQQRKIFNPVIVHGDDRDDRDPAFLYKDWRFCPNLQSIFFALHHLHTGCVFLFFDVFLIHLFLSFNQPILLSITKWFPQSSVLPSSSTVRFLCSLPDYQH